MGPSFGLGLSLHVIFDLNHSLSIGPRVELELFLFKMTNWASSIGLRLFKKKKN
jgi:hypothetical protein